MQQDRFCRNCGQELKPEDQFCAGCGRSVYGTARVPTPEADVPVPPPQASVQPPEQQPGEERDSTWWAMQGMVVVFLVLGVVETVQGMPPASPGKALGFRIGFGMAPALVATLSVAALVLLVGGLYYLSLIRHGAITFRESIFNWPMVIVAGVIAVLILLG